MPCLPVFLANFFSFVVVPSSASPQRTGDQRSTTSAPSAPAGLTPVVNGESNSLTSSVPYPATSLVSQNESENEGHLNPTEKLQ
jgi:pericentriolar material 1 protein